MKTEYQMLNSKGKQKNLKLIGTTAHIDETKGTAGIELSYRYG